MFSVLGPALLALAGMQELARQSLVVFPEHGARSIPWPAGIPALEKGRMVAGDVTGDLQPDAVLLDGGQPVLVYAPAIHSAVFALPFQANDLAVLPRGPGEASELVLVGASGVQRLSGYSAGQFQPTPAGSDEWLDARRILCADVDRDGAADLVGLSAQDEVLFLEDIDAPLPVETVLPIGEPVLDLAPIDWLGDGSPLVVAVLTSSGLTVRAASGELLFALGGATDGGELAVLRETDVPYERLSILHDLSGGQTLFVFDRHHVETPIPLGSPGAFGLVSGDADLEGNDDLISQHHVSHDSVLLRNRRARPRASATFGFAPKDVEFVGLAPQIAPLPSWSARPALHDFTRDGDPDLLAFVEATDEFVLVENATRAHERQEVRVLGGAYVFDEARGLGDLRLHVEVPGGLRFSPSHVEVIGWKQPDASSPDMDPIAAVHVFAPLDQELEALTRIPLQEPELEMPGIYHFELRAVRVSGTSVVAAGPTAVHAFTTPEALVSELEAQFGDGVELRVFVVEDGAELELSDEELADRLLAPKTVKSFQVPLIEFPPNPFG